MQYTVTPNIQYRHFCNTVVFFRQSGGRQYWGSTCIYTLCTISQNVLFICRLFKTVKHGTQPCLGTFDPHLPLEVTSGCIISIKINK